MPAPGHPAGGPTKASLQAEVAYWKGQAYEASTPSPMPHEEVRLAIARALLASPHCRMASFATDAAVVERFVLPEPILELTSDMEVSKGKSVTLTAKDIASIMRGALNAYDRRHPGFGGDR